MSLKGYSGLRYCKGPYLGEPLGGWEFQVGFPIWKVFLQKIKSGLGRKKCLKQAGTFFCRKGHTGAVPKDK